MATQETKQLDSIIASRRALLVGGGAAALAAAFMPPSAKAAVAVPAAGYADTDILNFALNLEYLEANFYWLAAFGTTIDKPNTASNAVGAPAASGLTGIAGQGGQAGPNGTVSVTNGAGVQFTIPAVKSYAIETAIEEVKHVNFLRSALSTAAVAQPNIDLTGGATAPSTAAWNTLASAAKIGPTFDPFGGDVNFLAAAYVFEDVGVSAYSGAAPAIKSKSILQAAASILAVEAYHAGLVRTTITLVDGMNTAGYETLTQQVSALRAALSLAANSSAPKPDDYGLVPPGSTGTAYAQYNLGGTTVSGTTIVDADPTNVIAFARNTTQVLNIVTGGGALTAGAVAKGVFFPNGMNGIIA